MKRRQKDYINIINWKSINSSIKWKLLEKRSQICQNHSENQLSKTSKKKKTQRFNVIFKIMLIIQQFRWAFPCGVSCGTLMPPDTFPNFPKCLLRLLRDSVGLYVWETLHTLFTFHGANAYGVWHNMLRWLL